jgi:vacuolar-type H+-ATPase subunit D/Vma8
MSSSTKSNAKMQQLKETLKSLESYKLPESLQRAFTAGTLDPALIERYKQARDKYLRRRVKATIIDHTRTFDGKDIELPPVPTPEEEETLKERLQQVLLEVQQTAQESHQKILELQEKHTTFCLRREELKKIVKDMEDTNDKKRGDESSLLLDDDGYYSDEDDDVEDEKLAQEEERLARLQQKKAQLQVQFAQLQQETNQLQIKVEKAMAEAAELSQQGKNDGEDNTNNGPSSPTTVQAEVEETRKKLEECKEFKIFYDGLREVMEELTMIQLISVGNAPADDAEDSDNDDNNPKNILIHVRFLEEHEIHIILRRDPKKPEEMRVVDAKFVTSTVVKGPAVDENRNKQIQLTIPPLNDLVQLCKMFPPGEELRFLVREAMSRVRLIKSRVVELTLLQGQAGVLTKIGTLRHNTEGESGEEQEVVCSINECSITVGLRLTADCPRIPSSVYIYQMVGVGGWNEADVNKIKERVSSQEYQTPLEVIQAIRGEVARLQEEEGVSPPKTPMLPLRRGKKN